MIASAAGGPRLFGIPVEFFLFGLTLLCVAAFHKFSLHSAVGGMSVIVVYKIATGYSMLPHLHHEWVILINLLCLLLGFAILSNHFEQSRIPEKLPAILPNDWKGGLMLLVLVFFLSTFLDNIAAAMIGGTVAKSVYKGRVHIGYIAAIVAASNAGGAGSVVGDTTTTMMWLDGVSPFDVSHAFVASFVALAVFGGIAAVQQQRYQPILKDETGHATIDWGRIGIVGAILAFAIAVNLSLNVQFGGGLGGSRQMQWWQAQSDKFPFMGAAVWIVILLTAGFRKPEWKLLPGALKGSLFLLSLVMAASLMPVKELPAPSWKSALGIGFISAVFDNIPLTKLALAQGGWDWGVLAYAVGFGGSMIWFGSSAGVAITIEYPDARSAGRWLRHGWHVALAYVIGFLAMIFAVGWHPHAPHKKSAPQPHAVEIKAAQER